MNKNFYISDGPLFGKPHKLKEVSREEFERITKGRPVQQYVFKIVTESE